MTRYAPRTPFKFSIHLPDHVADTVHLSAEEHGCYMRLLFSYWRSGPPKDDDRVLARIAGLSVEEWAEVRPMVEPFFEVLHGQWLHWRTDDELHAAYESIEKSSRAGKAAAKARWDKEKSRAAGNDKCEADAVAMRSQCESQFQQKDKGHAPSAGAKPQPKTPRAKAKDFEEDVAIAERDLGIGGAA
ncbi:MAG TPA: hypothetical protein DCY18_10905 [Thauera sp.]|mgnify:CR=1 FL=1|nr:hypothetical protein [Thauera sp.]